MCIRDRSTVADYTELVQDLMTIDGQISGLGMEIAVFGMFVNMDLLKECGIEKAPANYQEFLDACKAVTDAGHTAIAVSYTHLDVYKRQYNYLPNGLKASSMY